MPDNYSEHITHFPLLTCSFKFTPTKNLLVLIIRAHEYNLVMSVMMLHKISIKWRRHEYNNLTLNDMSYIQC